MAVACHTFCFEMGGKAHSLCSPLHPWRPLQTCCAPPCPCRAEADHLAEHRGAADGDLRGLPEEGSHAYSRLQLQPHRSEREI